LFAVLDELDPDIVVHGDCRGADRLAEDWGKFHKKDVRPYPANWLEYGRFAGPLRNAEMLAKEKPDLVIAFPGGTGTANMVKLAREARVKVMVIKPEEEE
jgi:hypothetical protein